MQRSTQTTAILFSFALLAVSCAHVDHPTRPATAGSPVSLSDAERQLETPGPITYEYIQSAAWAVPLSGLLNLDHPIAQAAALANRKEPIQVGLHRLSHPSAGEIWIDTGLSQQIIDTPADFSLGPLVRRVMNFKDLEATHTAEAVVEQHGAPNQVLLTHLHMDHVFGLPALPAETAIVVGPGEMDQRGWEGAALRATFNAFFTGRPDAEVLPFDPDTGDGIAGVVDLLGDGSLYALWTPGHTPGHMSFLLRTTNGPVLITGDASHTTWGWQNGVEPGSFNVDMARSARALEDLRALAARHPQMTVYTGHQHIPGAR